MVVVKGKENQIAEGFLYIAFKPKFHIPKRIIHQNMLSMQSIFLCFYASHTILLLIFDIDKRLWLTSLHQKVFYSDIVIRKSIRNERSMAQVSYSTADLETCKRETSALVKFNAFRPLKRSLIITYNEENLITINGQTIEVVPVWRWMLENEL